MDFKTEDGGKTGEVIGYIVMYFLFTIVLYFILTFLKKLPLNWGYFHVMSISLGLILVGKLIKEILK